jgi:hypothetical protein
VTTGVTNSVSIGVSSCNGRQYFAFGISGNYWGTVPPGVLYAQALAPVSKSAQIRFSFRSKGMRSPPLVLTGSEEGERGTEGYAEASESIGLDSGCTVAGIGVEAT